MVWSRQEENCRSAMNRAFVLNTVAALVGVRENSVVKGLQSQQHRVDRVFPLAPVRQAGVPAARLLRGGVEWVLSLAPRLRYLDCRGAPPRSGRSPHRRSWPGAGARRYCGRRTRCARPDSHARRSSGRRAASGDAFRSGRRRGEIGWRSFLATPRRLADAEDVHAAAGISLAHPKCHGSRQKRHFFLVADSGGGGAGGWSLLSMSLATFHEPSACLWRMTRYLP